MTIGLPKEIKTGESRVGLTPQGVKELVGKGHQVYVQQQAGAESGFADKEYVAAGAQMVATLDEVYAVAEMIVKVKEPIEPEYKLIRPGQLLFAYFHLASDETLTREMMASGATCLAYETVRAKDGSLPLLIPMSEIAGRMAIQEGVRFLEKPQGGKGILISGVPGVKPAKVLILGAGMVGTRAAQTAAGMGADVTIVDISLSRLRELDAVLPGNVKTLYSSQHNIEQELAESDLVIGSALIPGARCPYLVTKEMMKQVAAGTVFVDVAIDQGGCFETSHPTTHENPVYEVDGVLHYAVTNIPGAVPRTSTWALTNASLPYVLKLAEKGWKTACKEDSGLALGLNIVNGKIAYKQIADLYREPVATMEW